MHFKIGDNLKYSYKNLIDWDSISLILGSIRRGSERLKNRNEWSPITNQLDVKPNDLAGLH